MLLVQNNGIVLKFSVVSSGVFVKLMLNFSAISFPVESTKSRHEQEFFTKKLHNYALSLRLHYVKVHIYYFVIFENIS